MATIDIWIQLENHPWDVCPNWPVDRSEAEGAMPVGPLKQVFMRSPVSGKSRLATVRRPMAKDALLLRRYTAELKASDDRKVNPLDLLEVGPSSRPAKVVGRVRLVFGQIMITPSATWRMSASVPSG